MLSVISIPTPVSGNCLYLIQPGIGWLCHNTTLGLISDQNSATARFGRLGPSCAISPAQDQK